MLDVISIPFDRFSLKTTQPQVMPFLGSFKQFYVDQKPQITVDIPLQLGKLTMAT